MNRKYFVIMFIVLLLAIGSVSAVNMETHNFDNYFKMDIPEGTTVETDEETNSIEENNTMLTFYGDDWVVSYIDSLILSGDSVTWFYQEMFTEINPDLDDCVEYQYGEFRVLQPRSEDGMNGILMGTHSENETVIIIGSDFELVKKMADSLKY